MVGEKECSNLVQPWALQYFDRNSISNYKQVEHEIFSWTPVKDDSFKNMLAYGCILTISREEVLSYN